MILSPTAFTLFDGAMGTMLQSRGMPAGALPEALNLTHPDLIRAIHAEYVAAGADVITANTFGANARKLREAGADFTVADTVSAAVNLARAAGAKAVALDIGPTGALLKPLGTMPFDEAYALFAEVVEAGVAAGADLVLIETMSDLLEAKAALLAAREHSSLPVITTMTFAADGRTFLGTDPRTAAVTLSALGADAIGLNCSLGPTEAAPLVREILDYATVPVMVQPNAGLPRIETCGCDACVSEHTVYDVTPAEFVAACADLAAAGVTIFGGCCGTNPDFIRGLRAMLDATRPAPRTPIRRTAFTGTGRTVELTGADIAVIGERINPTGKKKLKEALRNRDDAYVVSEAIAQEEAGADILDVNAGLPELDEAETLVRLVGAIQAVSPLPLQIDSADPAAIEAACRVYAGKPIINSVSGKADSLAAVLPIAKKYGAAVVGLTLDEAGIPETAEGRLAIARRILDEALRHGIPREDVLIDCLTLTASTNQTQVRETLRAVAAVKTELGLRTVLGVSNVSFGLPNREILNANFLAAAFGAGLDMPILNPLATPYRAAVASYRVINGQDAGAVAYIEAAPTLATTAAPTAASAASAAAIPTGDDLRGYVISGRRREAEAAVRAMLSDTDAMAIINTHLIPALDEVGARFEAGKLFLPQLIASADAAKAGFDVIRAAASGNAPTRGRIVLATVKGDIHDIGKNIVRMLLENYGYDILDLGRDVDPAVVVEAVREENIKLVGLSALMTTTVRAMADTIAALRDAGLDCRVMVGGAVMTQAYADMIGADYYAKDAAESARIAAEVLG